MKPLIHIALIVAVVALLAAPQVVAQNLIYSSQLVDSTDWGYSHFGGTNPPVPGVDTATATFDWDYAQFGIPEAPNSDSGDSTRRGLRLTANDEGDAPDDTIAIYYRDDDFTGQYTVQVDVWANWASTSGSGVGTTEHAGVYVGFDPADVNPFLLPARNGAGILFDTDGDCGNCDYILMKDSAELDTFSGQYSVSDFGFGNQNGFDNTDSNGADVNLPEAFPSFDIATATEGLNGTGMQPAGAAGFQWMTVTVEVDTAAIGNGTNGTAGLATFSLKSARSGNSVTIGTVDNSVDDDPADGIDTGEAPVGMTGGFALMMIDDFGGNPDPIELGFMVFDNVRVYDGFLASGPDGDFNDDGNYDCDDVDALVAEIVAGTNDADFDLTDDGDVNGDDLDAWLVEGGVANVAATGGAAFLLGDANLDGTVDGGDFLIWNNNKFAAAAAWCSGDFDATGFVDGGDFLIWNTNKFMSSGGDQVVPEPASLLVFLGAGPLLWYRRRQRRA